MSPPQLLKVLASEIKATACKSFLLQSDWVASKSLLCKSQLERCPCFCGSDQVIDISGVQNLQPLKEVGFQKS